MLREAMDMTERVNNARAQFVKRHADKEGFERIEAMLLDLYGLMYTEYYVRPRDDK